MKPKAMVRALERAAEARWVAGKDERRKHIKALQTQNRESDEDLRECVARMEMGSQLLALRCQFAAFGIVLK